MPVLSVGGGAKGLIVGGPEPGFWRGVDGVEGDEEVMGPPEELAEGVASGEGGEDVTEGGSRRPKGLETYVIMSPAVEDDMSCHMRFRSTRGGTWARGVIIGTRAKTKGVG
jgi:hypothetical protein